MYRRRNTLVKECILPSLQTINIIITKIKAETTTKIAIKTTKTTETLVTIEHTNNQIAIADPRDVATSARKRIANYRSI